MHLSKQYAGASETGGSSGGGDRAWPVLWWSTLSGAQSPEQGARLRHCLAAGRGATAGRAKKRKVEGGTVTISIALLAAMIQGEAGCSPNFMQAVAGVLAGNLAAGLTDVQIAARWFGRAEPLALASDLGDFAVVNGGIAASEYRYCMSEDDQAQPCLGHRR